MNSTIAIITSSFNFDNFMRNSTKSFKIVKNTVVEVEQRIMMVG